MKKSTRALGMILCLVMVLTLPAYAQGPETPDSAPGENQPTSIYGSIDIQNIDESSGVTVSEDMTFDEW